jgi:hypothetical protein
MLEYLLDSQFSDDAGNYIGIKEAGVKNIRNVKRLFASGAPAG